MRLAKFRLLIVFLFLSLKLLANDGTITGKVFDAKTGEFLPGVSVYVVETKTGAVTDLDGEFSITLPPGSYSVRLSFVTYEPMTIAEVIVEADRVTVLENIKLKEASVEISSVTVTAEMVKNTANAILTVKMRSPSLLDGISSASFKRIGDSDAASSMKRVPGVSVSSGKYVYIRGLGDRYTKTILNGVDIPGLDPDRNTMQMDIFPSNIIDNIIVHKSFTADLPADFTGGIVDITIKDFPEVKRGSVLVGFGYNPGSHFKSNYLTYFGGGTDFMGFDNGSRAIPATSDIPQFGEAYLDPDGHAGKRYRDILNGFNPNLAAYEQTSMMDYNLGFSLGNQIRKKTMTIGYNIAMSYKSNTEFYVKAVYGRYGLSNDVTVNELDMREYQEGNFGAHSVMLSGLAGIALKTQKSKFRLNILHLQNGESKAGIFDYESNNRGTTFSAYQHNLDYSQRSVTNTLLEGKHSLGINKWEIEWKLSPTLSRQYDPDNRFTRYLISGSDLLINTEGGFPERIWRDLTEYNLAGLMNIKRDFRFLKQDANIKFGGSYAFKQRDFVIYNYMLNIRNVPLTGDPDELFAAENLWPRNGDIASGTTYEVPFMPVNPNKFNANSGNLAGYVSMEFSPLNKLRTILGTRVEKYTQRYTGHNQLNTKILNGDKVIDDLDVFVSVNLIYTLTEEQNLRFSYATTIARPSFKEMSYAEISDPISGRSFYGGMSPDIDNEAGVTYWDGDLKSTYIYNYDLRWEIFRDNGQTISVSGFYKKFNNPIEIVQYATQEGAFQPRNVGDGEVLGGEIELRQSFGMLSDVLKNFVFSANFTLTKSRIMMSTTEFTSKEEHARMGEKIGQYRDMAGQAPYIVNAGLAYNGGEKGFWNGFEAGLYYNVQGPSLQYAGINDLPDVYSVPFHSLNLNLTRKLGKNDRWQMGIKVENILDARNEMVYRSYEAENRYFTRLKPGTSFSFNMSYNLF